MGMMMLPPVEVSLPIKLIFFVLVDGWHLVAGSLVQSYGTEIPPTGSWICPISLCNLLVPSPLCDAGYHP